MSRMTESEFAAKLDYEGNDYMLSEVSPCQVPLAIRDAHKIAAEAYYHWKTIAYSFGVEEE